MNTNSTKIENLVIRLIDRNSSLIRNETEIVMSPLGYMLTAIILFFIGFIGFFFNLFVIILMLRNKQLWTPLNTVLFNLVCSDFSVSVLGNPWTFASAISHRWIFSQTICKMYGFIMSLLGITSITTLTVLAFERYIMVSRPFRCHLTHNRGLISIIFIWIYSLSLTLPPLFGWGEYSHEAANISCSVNWDDRNLNAMSYIIFLFVFGLAVPVYIIIFSYVNLLTTVKKRPIRNDKVRKEEKQLTLMILFMIAAFLIAWTPYAVMALLVQFGNYDIISPALAVIPALIAKSSICYNPIIYVRMNTQFRQAWQETFKQIGNAENTFTTNLTRCNPASISMKTLEYSEMYDPRQELKYVESKIDDTF